MQILEIAFLGAATTVWVAAELFLVFRDGVRGMGKTTIDRKTRTVNLLSITGALSAAASVAWIPMFQYDSRGVPVVFWTGFAILLLGLFLRYWSIRVLGRFFRTTVEIEQGQKVVQTGPYRWIRHPSYSGMILYCVGYGLATQNWLSLILTGTIPTLALLHRIKIEEAALIKGIGVEYEAYRKKTKKLIPGIW